ncbi:DUF6484 domain-containing protein [Amaricoccus sp.]|uniref:DUF6484 domain-containing protein n=1 Tax=Amaricoccus sp. TaxID=1872485 RepID=UPI00262AB7D4|nr:DUF6484 domain-containing protein [Amaricoccus sp.]HRO10394.1 DUF6484 domain-containing protein [Amaricoccus sp.]
MTTTLERIDGVVIGALVGFEAEVPLVVFAGNPRDAAVPARTLAPLDYAAIGAEVALLFEAGDPARPLIVGRIVDPARRPAPVVVRDGERVRVTAEERIELRVGKASIIMEKDGRIIIRGSYVTSHASATMRIRGGSVNLN